MFSGSLSLDVDYTPALPYQVAKMDGAIVLNNEATQIVCANVQLMPDPTILSLETGTRHRTAERVSGRPMRWSWPSPSAATSSRSTWAG